jgi:hypothetical protein
MNNESVFCDCPKVHIHGRWVSPRTYLAHQALLRSSSLREATIRNETGDESYDLPPTRSTNNSPNEIQHLQEIDLTEVSSGVKTSPMSNDFDFNNSIEQEDDGILPIRESNYQEEVEFLGYVFDKNEEQLETDSDIDDRNQGDEEEENSQENDENSESHIRIDGDEDDPNFLRFLLRQLKELSGTNFPMISKVEMTEHFSDEAASPLWRKSRLPSLEVQVQYKRQFLC